MFPISTTAYEHFSIDGETKVLNFSQEFELIFKKMQDAEGNWCWTYPMKLPEQDWKNELGKPEPVVKIPNTGSNFGGRQERIELPPKTVGPSVKPRASPLYFFSAVISPGAG